MPGAQEGTQLTFLVEHYRPGLSVAEFREAARRMSQAADEITSSDSPIRFLHSTLVPQDETAFCVFGAASQMLVEDAYRRAGVPFERIVEALELETTHAE